MFNIPTDWAHILKDELSKPYVQQLEQFVTEQYKQTTVYPPKDKIFAALEHTPFDKVRVVILGQDPLRDKTDSKVNSINPTLPNDVIVGTPYAVHFPNTYKGVKLYHDIFD